MRRSISMVIAVAFLAAAGPALAEEERDDDRSSWHVAFVGGMLMPLREMEGVHKTGLSLGSRVGWSSSVGLGLEVAANYAPLARKDVPELTSVETHFVSATAGPRFSLGRKFRLWTSVTGGVVAERATEKFRGEVLSTNQELAPAVSAALGIDLAFASSGGFTLMATGHKAFGELDDYEFVQATGGLVFTF